MVLGGALGKISGIIIMSGSSPAMYNCKSSLLLINWLALLSNTFSWFTWGHPCAVYSTDYRYITSYPHYLH